MTNFKATPDAVQLVLAAILSLNALRKHDLPGELETCLLGPDSALDSMDLVQLIVLVEEEIEAVTGKSVILANERAMSRSRSPFRTVGSLMAYVAECLEVTE